MPKVVSFANEGEPIRAGTGKNGKPYSIFEVVVDDGQSVQVFAPVKLGDEITGIMFDEKYNVTKGNVLRPGGSGAKDEKVLDAIRQLYGKVQNIELLLYKMGAKPLTGEEKARAQATAIKDKVAADAPKEPEPEPEPLPPDEPDVVVEPTAQELLGGEPINLDNIPF